MARNKHDVFAREIGCIICLLYNGQLGEPADIHHPISGNKRIGDNVFFALCPYHHRGICTEGFTPAEMKKQYGPSLALHKKEWLQCYGSDEFLLSAQKALYDKWLDVSGLQEQ